MNLPALTALLLATSALAQPVDQQQPRQISDPDACLQNRFLSAPLCGDQGLTNDTLPAAGWYCCWDQPVFAPGNPRISAWLKQEDGVVTERCLTNGTCPAL